MDTNNGGSHNRDDQSQHNASAEAAAFVRGLARSVGRSVGRIPIGSLPRRAIFKRRLPVRQVARVSDRLSTGLDWFTTAVKTTEGTPPKLSKRVTIFATSLLKNTLLGAAVFETYGYIIFKLAPLEITATKRQLEVEDDDGRLHVELYEDDEFSRVSLGSHFAAGAVAGTVHGVASTVMEVKGANNMLRSLPNNALQHTLAHSLLFGSYEGIKRVLLENVSVEDFYGGEYLVSFGVAGGLAGQIQHVASHYAEQFLGRSEQQPKNRKVLRNLAATAPALRPTMLAFLPSAIGFIAFEYGKKFVS